MVRPSQRISPCLPVGCPAISGPSSSGARCAKYPSARAFVATCTGPSAGQGRSAASGCSGSGPVGALAFLSSLRRTPGGNKPGIGNRIGGGGAVRSRETVRQTSNNAASTGAPGPARKPNAPPFTASTSRDGSSTAERSPPGSTRQRASPIDRRRAVSPSLLSIARTPSGASVTRPSSGGAFFSIAEASSLQPSTASG